MFQAFQFVPLYMYLYMYMYMFKKNRRKYCARIARPAILENVIFYHGAKDKNIL